MTTVLRYGSDSVLQLELPPTATVTQCGQSRGEPLDDPAAAMAAALTDPLDFPPLARCVVPGDRVTIALDPGLPQLPALVAGAVESLLCGGVEPSHITLLRSIDDAKASADDPRDALSSTISGSIEVVTHDPEHRAELRYLAASESGKPIYLNRWIQEADLVLPIGCLRVESSLGYHGIHGGLYPTFSDSATLDRFRNSINNPARGKRRRAQIEQVAWLLGLSLTVQVVPAAGGQVLHILAGEVQRVLERGRTLCEHAWRYRVPRRANLVVAAIDGHPREQTWENVARALAAASKVVADGGAIALCTDLADAPGPSLRRLADAADRDHGPRRKHKKGETDAAAAAELRQAMDRATIYLLSRLDQEVVENLGVAPVENASELSRLSRRFDSCILLSSAQYAVVTPESE